MHVIGVSEDPWVIRVFVKAQKHKIIALWDQILHAMEGDINCHRRDRVASDMQIAILHQGKVDLDCA